MSADLKGALAALRNGQRQLDHDGVEVGVSRQALDEVLAFFEQPAPGETVFTLRVGGSRTQLHTLAGEGVEPMLALISGADVFVAELKHLQNCPAHMASARSGEGG